MQRIGDGCTGQVLGGRAIERSGDTVCGLHHARGDKESGFLGVTSKPRWWRVFRFEPQNRQLWFSDLDLKITVTVF
jgi:hypothetical protein